MSDEKQVVDFSPPGADEYRQRIEKAKAGQIPVGGAPMPKMPRLDQDPGGDRHAGVQSPRIPVDRILTQAQREELERQGKLMPGVGSGYAANQPKITDEAPPAVVNPPRAEGGLRPETIAGLEQMAKAQMEPQPQDPNLTKAMADVAKEVEREVDDFGEFGQRVRSLINNRKRREAIEKRITDILTIEDLISVRELRQTVPIIPGKFFPTFRSTSGHEDLWVKRAMGTETGSETYIADKYAMMNLVCGLFAINGSPLPDHLNKEGYVDEALFNKKYDTILKYPWNMLGDMSVNYVWFLHRVEKVLVVDDIKDF